ncbi:MAG: hypothetical protein JO349_07780 [Candidatus Eremiobacteraeota bacterium]|nr:hypothetical protein [Candidatus Eremiobacteraeota bacterium]
MEREDRPKELHTEADDEKPLTSREAEVMGEQAVRRLRDIPKERQTVFGEVDEGFDNEDQADAHHADPGEHV